MKYELNVKMEDGMVKSTITADIEMFGFKVKCKEYKIEGDLNETVSMLTDMISKPKPEGALISIENIFKAIGLKKATIDKFKKAYNKGDISK